MGVPTYHRGWAKPFTVTVTVFVNSPDEVFTSCVKRELVMATKDIGAP